jgi:SAM-dependent methyltransferase
VLGDAAARSVFTELARQLRAAGYDGSPTGTALVTLARGEPIPVGDLLALVGSDGADALVAVGAAVIEDDIAFLTTKFFPMRSVLTLLPPADSVDDVVYLGVDSVLLLDVVWRRGGVGRHAADLGTGNGFIAAALATRFDHVVAADISPRCVSTAAMVPVLNPHLVGRFSALQLDVAGGLSRGAFDLVTANAPWVPEVSGPDGGSARLFAAGGPTGFELPRRFIDEATALLAPGGQAFVACMDIEFADGERPVLEHVAAVAAHGFEVEVIETRLNKAEGLDAWAAGKNPDARHARHVVVLVRRPGEWRSCSRQY